MTIRKVLFFKPGAIGDFLHTLPALAGLRKSFSEAHITVVVSSGQDELIRGTGVADDIIIFDKSKMKEHPLELLALGRSLRRTAYDLFVDMQPSLRSLVLRRMAGAGRTLVYKKQRKAATGQTRFHAVENFLRTLAPLGVSPLADEIHLPVRSDAASLVDRYLTERNIAPQTALVALNCSVGAARPARNWFPERFAALADRIASQRAAAVIFIGGREDRDLVASVISRMQQKAISSAGELSLAQTAALLARCRCLVSSDTGPLHLATAVGTPVVGLYGSTDPRRTGPLGPRNTVLIRDLPCVPCEEKRCPLGTQACMASLSVEDVFDAVRKVLA